jgi:crotonobetainyl-CoA:carnitine CoA-transferase CaiB-like acyl-CoA transferase
MTEYLFSGLKVIDASAVIAAPVAATILADFGADVIKVEQPGTGDMLRGISYIATTPDADTNYLWHMDGRNKRSIVLDLKTTAGMEVLRRLVADCDVFVTNHPLPVRRALKLNYDDLKPLNPRLIYASLSAYGEEGPDRDGKGFDQLAYWSRSGLMDLMRDPSRAPTQGLPGMGDHPTGVALYAGIVTALLRRERTGEGGRVHTSLLANGLWSASSVAQGGFAGGDLAGFRERNRVVSPGLKPYRTKDDRWLILNMLRTPEEFGRFLDTLGDDRLKDPRFETPRSRFDHRAEFGEIVEGIILERTSDEWLALFRENHVPVNRVAVLEEVIEDPQIRINQMVVPPVDPDVGVPLIINHPIKVDGVPQVGPKRGPELAEHTDEILKELGYTDAEIQALRDEGAIQD